MFAVDIVSFSSRHDPLLQNYLRTAVHRIVRDSCAAAGLRWETCHHEDRGDGLFVIASPDLSVEVLLDPLVAQVRATVRQHNKLASRTAQIRLRMAVHAGYIRLDDHGAAGVALIHLFRLLDAPAFKDEFADHSGDFALIVSDHLYEEVLQYGPGLVEAASFAPVIVSVKETYTRAWLWLPPDWVRTSMDIDRPHRIGEAGLHALPSSPPSGALLPMAHLTPLIDLLFNYLSAGRDSPEVVTLLADLRRQLDRFDSGHGDGGDLGSLGEA